MTAGRTVIGNSRDWCTPPKYVKAVKDVLGTVALDPCSNKWSQVNAEVEFRLPEADGLREIWDHPTIYVNPPYGSDVERGTKIIDWLKKCADAHQDYGSEVIALVPIAANTKHWKLYVWPKASAICFLYDTRLRFLVNGKDDGKGAPMACAAIYWGSHKERFAEVFKAHGAVVDLHGVAVPTEARQPALKLISPARRYG